MTDETEQEEAQPQGVEVKEVINAQGFKEVPRWRTALPQVLASTAKNLLLLDLGMTIGFPTIVIPALQDGIDSKGLTFTPEQASWFGSIMFICQPVGSVLSGIVLEPFGRKYSMMLVNLPHILGWFLLSYASSETALYIAAIIMGLGLGFMEAPIITYVGEVCEPRLRGTLTSYSNLFATFGVVLTYFLGTLVDWRTAALLSVIVPCVTILAISQIPETPLWLLAKDRKEDAEKALCWLRGWVPPANVASEFKEMIRYTEETKLRKEKKKTISAYANPISLQDEGLKDPPTTMVNVEEETEFEDLSFMEKVKDFLRPQMLKPLGLIVGFFVFANMTGIISTRPYLVKVIEKFKFPMEAHRATVLLGSIGFCASVLCMVTIAKFNKRPIAIGSLTMCCISACLIGIGLEELLTPWFPFIMFLILQFFTSYGTGGLVWTLVSEVFPNRGRSLASGIAAASSYVITFFATKSFLWLETNLTPHGVFFLYGALSMFGAIFLFYALPETEGISLEEIEKHYKKKEKK